VASELGLQNRPEFNSENTGSALLAQLGLSNQRPFQGLQDEDERLLAAVYQKFAAALTDEGLIAVRLASADPQLAAKFVNRAVELYLAGLWSKAADGSPVGAGSLQAAAWAKPPVRPAFPRKGPISMLCMAVTLLLGLGGIATREAFRSAAAPRERHEARVELSSFGRTASPAAAADRVLSLPETGRGCRIMVAGEALDIDATVEALTLAKSLSNAGRRVVVVRWSLAGGSVAGGQSPRGIAGINDLIEGRATFEEIITRLPGSRAHAIAAGSPVGNRSTFLDQDHLGLVLDTLDEVYEHIVVIAEHEEARTLFAAIEGRFDVCLSVGESGRPAGALAAEVDRFLGFEVTDIHVMRLLRKRPASPAASATPLQARLA